MSTSMSCQRVLFVVLAILGLLALLRDNDSVDNTGAAGAVASADGYNKNKATAAVESSPTGGGGSSEQSERFQLALQESAGFFDDIDEREWLRLQQRHVDQFPNHVPSLLKQGDDKGDILVPPANTWYQENFEAEFSCRHERRIGRKGDGGKWVCDPHRIADQHAGCLVYSIGSSGDVSFEKSVKMEISDACEIHTFDIDKDKVRPSGQVVDYATELKAYATFHQYGIGTLQQATAAPTKFKTLKQIMKDLGHEGRAVDIFKIDCEGCEWKLYEEIFQSEIALQQILIEVHEAPMPAARNLFYTAHDAGYVIFHKEPNTIQENYGRLVEYAFLKLEKGFFRNKIYPSIKRGNTPTVAPRSARIRLPY
mmetsp:Transcript_25310/g.42053  ORF Transcript_25310/g.42053 Transcript_25310/m.42053 type:complete len:367 (-) Transcript_25310:180-1280(-)